MKYNTDLLGNLDTIRKLGVKKFALIEEEKWIRDGNKIQCIHDGRLYKIREPKSES